MTLSKYPLLTGRELTAVHRWASGIANALEAAVFVYQSEEQQRVLMFHSIPDDCWDEDRSQFEILRNLPSVADNKDLLAGNRLNAWSVRKRWFDGLLLEAYEGRLPWKQLDFVIAFHPGTITNPRHLSAAIEGEWKAVQSQEESNNSRIQSHAFVQQVTQDFEELTWLRGVSQQFGDAEVHCSIHELARIQLPLLRNVIKSEFVAFVPAIALDSKTDETSGSRIVYTGDGLEDWNRLLDFLRFSEHQGSEGVSVFNVQTAGDVFRDYPEFRNCIIARIEKHGRAFGCLVAMNKKLEFLGESPEDFLCIDPNGFQFGTFEAGLLSSLAIILASHATNSELFREQESLLTGVVRAIINAIDAKDSYTCGHSDRVASFAKSIAAQMGFDPKECEKVYMSGLLHDVGKIGIPDSILSKPGKLTDEEFDTVKKHPEIGFHILKHLKPLEYVLPGVLHHHEAVCGMGYPAGLIGEAIPIYGRILAVADAYDAMTSDRPYRRGMPSERAESILRQESGRTWDESVVQAMLRCIEYGTVNAHSSTNPELQGLAIKVSETQSMRVVSH